jgi:hypothetical protein
MLGKMSEGDPEVTALLDATTELLEALRRLEAISYMPDGYENNDELTCEDVTLTFNPQTKKTVLPTSSNSELVTLDSRHPQ